MKTPQYNLPYFDSTRELLCENGTGIPTQFLKKYNQKLGEIGRNVVLGISIENYSAFSFDKVTISKYYTRDYNRIIHDKSVKEIHSYTEYFFVMDNNNHWNYGIKGMISLELTINNHERKRLTLKFDEPYR